MGFFARKLRAFSAAAVVLLALLSGSCFPPSVNKMPLGAPADEATHAPELVGIWEKTNGCFASMEVLKLRPDGLAARMLELDGGKFLEIDFEWSTDGSVLFERRRNQTSVLGDYLISENTLRIKYADRGCTAEYKLGTRDTSREVK